MYYYNGFFYVWWIMLIVWLLKLYFIKLHVILIKLRHHQCSLCASKETVAIFSLMLLLKWWAVQRKFKVFSPVKNWVTSAWPVSCWDNFEQAKIRMQTFISTKYVEKTNKPYCETGCRSKVVLLLVLSQSIFSISNTNWHEKYFCVSTMQKYFNNWPPSWTHNLRLVMGPSL